MKETAWNHNSFNLSIPNLQMQFEHSYDQNVTVLSINYVLLH